MEFRAAIEKDAQDLQHACRAGRPQPRATAISCRRHIASGNDWLTQERQLDAAAMTLRRTWLRRRPSAGRYDAEEPARRPGRAVACGADVSFGYEREIDARLLEQRRPATSTAGRLVEPISSCSAAARPPSPACSSSPPRSGARAERAHRRPCRRLFRDGVAPEVVAAARARPNRDTATADIVIAEPVWCDGQPSAAAKRSADGPPRPDPRHDAWPGQATTCAPICGMPSARW